MSCANFPAKRSAKKYSKICQKNTGNLHFLRFCLGSMKTVRPLLCFQRFWRARFEKSSILQNVQDRFPTVLVQQSAICINRDILCRLSLCFQGFLPGSPLQPRIRTFARIRMPCKIFAIPGRRAFFFCRKNANHEDFRQLFHMPLRGAALRAPRLWDLLGRKDALQLLNVMCQFPREAGRENI